MSRAKQCCYEKRKSKTARVLGLAGLSVTLASGESLAATAPPATLRPAALASHEITLREEAIFDVSLATFYVIDREGREAGLPGPRLACGCWTGTYYTSPSDERYSSPPSRMINRAHERFTKRSQGRTRAAAGSRH
jgi:hypothetical protein